ncbi:MAG: hypothetical protein PHY04_02815 [Candidatus ainarchaeum sp.]|jgi:signal peptidase I|nr:hypothetical protein [Candidatus ainarchaeum sp.]MDD3086000.1 hypothetical protein [Candidatus ainarchaeum sp.]MDD4128641.1 hypothetical protein [Candidatus ainarchaeum sp.]MDD4467961.1 hypothetical protein [Candidatus ainarchaeum sp.]HPM85850.1 hypothetical protein [archaeon]
MVKFLKKKSDLKDSFLKNFLSSFKKKFSFLSFLDPFTYVDLWVMPFVKKKTNESKLAEFLVNLLFAFIFAIVAYYLLSLLFGSSSPLVIVYSASMEPTFFRGDIMALGAVKSSDYFGPEVILPKSISVRSSPVKNYATAFYLDSSKQFLEKIVFPSDNNFVKEIYPDKNGVVIVYPAYNPNSPIHNIPIIHRSIAKIVSKDGNFILTKGDNSLTNPTFDEDCGLINTELELSQKNCITLYAVPIESIQGKAFFKIPVIGCFKIWVVDNLSSLLFTGKLPSDYRGIC